ncbi:MAG TPA: hypothetical protein VNY35_06695 [Solirubrobacteraceae bacterium]|jgi:hypothetical protein|nr:hypothetical protein [Solirubrobacteraceae bacterium]
MFASVRRYRLIRGSMEDLARLVDTGFAEQIDAQPGFVSYEFADCGEGEIATISLFREAFEAEMSRDVAQHWTDENLADFEFMRTEALHGEILVSRAAPEVLASAHAAGERKFASLRRYALRSGSVEELMHLVDEGFADQIQELDGFEAYHALDCGRGEILSITLLRDQSVAEESDERALDFVRERLGGFDIERTEMLAGEVLVSRAMAELLEPAHA